MCVTQTCFNFDELCLNFDEKCLNSGNTTGQIFNSDENLGRSTSFGGVPPSNLDSFLPWVEDGLKKIKYKSVEKVLKSFAANAQHVGQAIETTYDSLNTFKIYICTIVFEF